MLIHCPSCGQPVAFRKNINAFIITMIIINSVMLIAVIIGLSFLCTQSLNAEKSEATEVAEPVTSTDISSMLRDVWYVDNLKYYHTYEDCPVLENEVFISAGKLINMSGFYLCPICEEKESNNE